MPRFVNRRRRQRRRRFRRLFLEQFEDRRLLSAFITVNSTADSDVRDNVLTLREAIEINNRTLPVASLTSSEQLQVVGTPTSADTDTIAFNVPGTGVHTIVLTSNLPAITDPVIVDGYTQPGAAPNSDPNGFNGTILIEIRGLAASNSYCLILEANSSTIRGLILNHAGEAGLEVTNFGNSGGSGNVIQGNFIGTNAAGTASIPNFNGIDITGNALAAAPVANNLIGGPNPADRNIISGNTNAGISPFGTSAGNGLISGTMIKGNFIGTDATGTIALGNSRGFDIQSFATGTVIGGSGAGEGNLISGNKFDGVGLGGWQSTATSGATFGGPSTGNVILGNKIGTDVTGLLPLGNGTNGVTIGFPSPSVNTVGGTGPGQGNIIAFNGLDGVSILRSQTVILSNSIFSNANIGIALDYGAGTKPNDTGDADTGPNNLQNFPEISSASAVNGGNLSVTYRIPSDPSNSAYPLRIEFFRADNTGQGKAFLGFDIYNSAQANTFKTATFISAVALAAGDKIVVTATDTASTGGNTSEFSASVQVSPAPPTAALVADINPGSGDSGPGDFAELNGEIFFSAAGQPNNSELWKTDGTAGGTVLVKELRSGNSGSSPHYFTNVNGTLFFVANDGVHGNELWKTDGTAAGTIMVTDNIPDYFLITPRQLTNVNGTLYFFMNYTNRLWKSDGTAAGTVEVTAIDGSTFYVQNGTLANANGRLFAFASAGDQFGTYKPWVIENGQPRLLKDTGAGGTTLGLSNFVDVNGTTFFTSYLGSGSYGLWKSDGTESGTVLVRDFSGTSSAARPTWLTNVNGSLFFTATEDSSDHDIWKSDGTTAGTVLVKDLYIDNVGSASPKYLTAVGDKLFFVARVLGSIEHSYVNKVWTSDGTSAGTTVVPTSRVISLGNNSPQNLTNVNGVLYFTAYDQIDGQLLWRSDGTSAGTSFFGDRTQGPGSPLALQNVNGTLVFQARDGAHGNELWMAGSVNAPPSSTDNVITTLEDTQHVFSTDDFGYRDPSDSPPDILSAVKVTTLPSAAAGILSYRDSPLHAGQFVAASDISAGLLRFLPTANSSGSAIGSFTFQVQDNGGIVPGSQNLDSTPNTITLNVMPVNDAPSGSDVTVSAVEDVTYSFQAADFGYSDLQDVPPNNLRAVKIKTLPIVGNLTNAGAAVHVGDFISVSALNSGFFRYRAPLNVNGNNVASFTFQVQDDGGTAIVGIDLDPTPNTIQINVTPVNDPPIAANDSYSTGKDAPLTVAAPGVLANDVDVDVGDSKTVVGIPDLSAGVHVIFDEAVNGDLPQFGTPPTLILQSGTNELRGTTSVSSTSDFDKFIIRVPANSQLVSAAFSATQTQGGLDGVSWDVYRGTSFPLSKIGTVSVSVPSDQSILTSLVPLGPGDYQFWESSIDLFNSSSGSANYQFTFTITSGSSIGTPVVLASGAIVTLQADGGLRYDPNGKFAALGAGQTATDSFLYSLADQQGSTSSATVTITILGSDTTGNQPPTITSNGGESSATISVPENTTAVTDVNATDPDAGNTLTYSISGGADAAKFAIDATTGVLTFLSAPDFETPTDGGADNVYDVVVQVSDGSATDTQAIGVTVTNVNETPVITSNGGDATASISIPENSTAVTDVDATDPDALANLTYSKAGGADASRFSINATSGVLTFISPPNFENPTDAGQNNVYDVIVRVSDGSLSATQTISVTVTNVIEPPTITSNGGGATASVSVPENTVSAADVNASGEAGSTLVYSISGGADALKFSLDAATGLLTFLAAPNFESSSDVGGNNVYDVVVQVSDGALTDTQSIAVTVTDINDTPQAIADEYSTSEDAPVSIAPGSGVLANDTDEDADDSKTVVSVAGGGLLWDESIDGDLPDSGTSPVLLLAPGLNEIRGTTGYAANEPVDLDGFVIQVPAGTQLSSALYSVTRATGAIDQISWHVFPLLAFGTNVPADNFQFLDSVLPVGAGQYELLEGFALKQGGGNLSDLANYLFRFNVTGQSTVGRELTLPSGALSTIEADGSFLYDPNGKFESLGVGQTTTDSFTYTVADSQGSISTATVTVTIHGENDAPKAADDAITLAEDGLFTLQAPGLMANDTDVDAGDTRTVVSINGQLAAVGQSLALVSGAVLTVNADGGYTYDPNHQFESLGAGQMTTDSFTYTMADREGATSSATVTVMIMGENDAPLAVDDVATANEDAILEGGGILSNDADPDADDSKAIVAINGQAGAVGTKIALPSGALLTVDSKGDYYYDPNRQFESVAAGKTATDSFTYTVADSHGATATATCTITIEGLNDVPIAANDTATTGEDDVLTLAPPGLLANDTDIDSGDIKTIVAINGQATAVGQQVVIASGALLTVHGNGSYAYDPRGKFDSLGPGQTATDSFTYTMADGQGATSSATATISIRGANDAPAVSLNGSLAISEGSSIAKSGSFADVDVSDAWTATVDYGDGSGPHSLPLAADKTFLLMHTYVDNGHYAIAVVVRDSGGLMGTGTLPVNVQNVAPQHLSFAGPEFAARGQTLLFVGGFSDPGVADTHTAMVDWGDGTNSPAVVSEAGGVGQVNAAHMYAAGGIYTATLTVSDHDGGSSTLTTTTLVVGASLDHGVLEMVGSSQRDSLNLSLLHNLLRVTGTLSGASANFTFTYPGIRQIVALLGSGNDSLIVDSKIRVHLQVDAGAGKDTIFAGGGPAVIVGGSGNDALYGGIGRDVLIGGAGRDQLSGGGGSDLLIAGATAYDMNAAALAAILSEWSSTRSLAARSANLRSGNGPVLAGTGVMLMANATVFADNDVDTLVGGSDLDWFIFDLKKDKAKDRTQGELLN